MTKPKGSTGGRLIHLTTNVYRIVLWLLTSARFDLGFTATPEELQEANKQKENFVVIGVGDDEWPNGYRLEHQKTGKLYVPDLFKEQVLESFHPIHEPKRRGTHLGVKRTYNLIKQRHYNITQDDVSAWLKKCSHCHRVNPNMNAVDDCVPIVSSYVNERWVIDTTYMVELVETNDGYKYIGTGMDHFSKFPFAVPLKTRSAEEWASALAGLCYLYDAPDVIHSDNGKEFRNEIFTQLESYLDIKLVHGNPYRPNEQGLVEKWNHTLKSELTKLMNQHNTTNWTQFLPQVCASYAMTPHLVTGFSPFEIYFGRKPRRLIATDGPTSSPAIPEFSASHYEASAAQTLARMNDVTAITKGRIIKNGAKMIKQKGKKSKPTFSVGTRVLVYFTEIPKKLLRSIYGVIKKRSREDLKLIVGQEPYRALGVISGITKHRRYKVILQHNGEELKQSVSSKKLKAIGENYEVNPKPILIEKPNEDDHFPPDPEVAADVPEVPSFVSDSEDSIDDQCNSSDVSSELSDSEESVSISKSFSNKSGVTNRPLSPDAAPETTPEAPKDRESPYQTRRQARWINDIRPKSGQSLSAILRAIEHEAINNAQPFKQKV